MLLWILGGLGLVYLVARSETGSTFVTDILSSGSRGIRNNNPGNIRKSGTVWAGQAPIEAQTDPAFVTFTAPEYGLRAMAKILKNYFAAGYDTLAKVATRWAPPTENDTAAYIAALSQTTGLDPNARLSAADLPRVIPAIVKHENGSQPYSASLINKGIELS